MKYILFICTGNTCRSAMAEGFFNTAAQQDSQLFESYKAFSAGIMAMDGESASSNAISALKEGWNIDISSHKAKALKYEYIKKSCLILTMTKAHKDAAIHLFPGMDSKIYTLKEYAANFANQGLQKMAYSSYGQLEFFDNNKLLEKYNLNYNYDLNYDVPDPYGQSLDFYKYCAQNIKKSIDKIIEYLKLKNSNS